MKTMKIKYLLPVLLLGFAPTGQAQTLPENLVRYIDVTGTSEMEVEPDEIVFVIRLKEYWEEEFAKKSKPEDYKTKVPLDRIEKGVMEALSHAGVRKEDISVRGVGDSWRERGREFLVGKQLEVRLYDFKTVENIVRTIDTRGIEHMSIDRMENKNIARYREQGKIEALKAARHKAEYLLEAVGKRVGEVIRIEEPDDNYTSYDQSNVMMLSSLESAADGGSFDSVGKIKLSYRMRVRFQIADYL